MLNVDRKKLLELKIAKRFLEVIIIQHLVRKLMLTNKFPSKTDSEDYM